MMFRERPRALCARALARFSHVPGAAGRDRGARVVTGGAKRTRRREDPTEPECGDVRTDLSQWWHSRTNPSARGYPNAPDLVAACTERTRSVRVPNEPKRVGDPNETRARERPERTRAPRQSDELDFQPSCTNEPERVAIRTNPSTRAGQTNPSGAAVRRTRLPTELHERTQAGPRSERTRAVR